MGAGEGMTSISLGMRPRENSSFPLLFFTFFSCCCFFVVMAFGGFFSSPSAGTEGAVISPTTAISWGESTRTALPSASTRRRSTMGPTGKMYEATSGCELKLRFRFFFFMSAEAAEAATAAATGSLLSVPLP